MKTQNQRRNVSFYIKIWIISNIHQNHKDQTISKPFKEYEENINHLSKNNTNNGAPPKNYERYVLFFKYNDL